MTNAPTSRVIEARDSDELLDFFTKCLLQQASQSISQRGVFNLVLSNSDVLEDVYARLMYDPDMRVMPWNETHLWFLGSQDQSIVVHSGIPEENVHVGEIEESIDCCVVAPRDITGLSEDMNARCSAFLILAKSRAEANSVSWTHQGVAHWFC